jgi:hypothetical protein
VIKEIINILGMITIVKREGGPCLCVLAVLGIRGMISVGQPVKEENTML